MANKVMTMPAPESEQPIQREIAPEENKEEEVQAKPLAASIAPLMQRETAPEENKEEEVQTKPLAGNIQRETTLKENKEEEVQTKPAPESKSQASGNVESQLSASKGGGSPLSDEVRAFMESRFGADFSSVQVHTDGAAAQMNKELGAQAFAHGSDIYYGAGKLPAKDELTAHELTHVVEQTGASSRQHSADSSVQPKCTACEAEEAEVANKNPSINFSKSAQQLLQRKASPGSASPMLPPGDCQPGEHRRMQDEVDKWCKGNKRCSKSQTLEEVEESAKNASKCINARMRMNNKCFRGGDAGHKTAIDETIKMLVRCQKVRDELVKARQPQQEVSPDFMKKMAEITGLTGTALLMYIIISEGSRLFPPRNLIPVP